MDLIETLLMLFLTGSSELSISVTSSNDTQGMHVGWVDSPVIKINSASRALDCSYLMIPNTLNLIISPISYASFRVGSRILSVINLIHNV